MEAGYRYDDARASNQAMLIYLVVTSLILEMDLMEMFDMLDERPTGAAGQWKWNEPRGVFYQSLKTMRLQFIYLFVCLFRWHTQIKRHE